MILPECVLGEARGEMDCIDGAVIALPGGRR